MTDRTTRLLSFALAAVVTTSVLIGIDAMALGPHAAAVQLSQSQATPGSAQTAALPAAPRS